MAFGDPLPVSNEAPTVGASRPVFNFNFFDASKYDPSPVAVPVNAVDNPFLQALEEAAKRTAEEEAKRKAEAEASKRQRQIELAENTLVLVAGQGAVETAKVAAAKILLERFDTKEEIKKLKAEMAELKESMAASNDSSDEDLPPGLRRRK